MATCGLDGSETVHPMRGMNCSKGNKKKNSDSPHAQAAEIGLSHNGLKREGGRRWWRRGGEEGGGERGRRRGGEREEGSKWRGA